MDFYSEIIYFSSNKDNFILATDKNLQKNICRG